MENGGVVAALELLAALLVLLDERDLVLRGPEDHPELVLGQQAVGDVSALSAAADDEYLHVGPPVCFEADPCVTKIVGYVPELRPVLRADQVEDAPGRGEPGPQEKAARLQRGDEEPARHHADDRRDRVQKHLERPPQIGYAPAEGDGGVVDDPDGDQVAEAARRGQEPHNPQRSQDGDEPGAEVEGDVGRLEAGVEPGEDLGDMAVPSKREEDAGAGAEGDAECREAGHDRRPDAGPPAPGAEQVLGDEDEGGT